MKKIIAICLMIVMLFTMAACGKEASNNKIEKFVEENGSEFLSAMEESFAKSSGMTCTSSIEAKGSGFVVDININELDDLDDETKSQMQSTYDSLGSSFDGMLESLQEELPELEYFEIRVCEKDGDVIATIRVDE